MRVACIFLQIFSSPIIKASVFLFQSPCWLQHSWNSTVESALASDNRPCFLPLLELILDMVLVLHRVPAVSCFIGTFSSYGWGSAGLWWSHGCSLSGMTWTWVLAWHRTFSFCPFVLSTASSSARECHPLHSHLRSVWVSDTFMGHHWAVSHIPASLTWDAVLRPDTHFHFCPRRPQWSQLWGLTWTNTFCVGTSLAPPPPLLGVCPAGLPCISRDAYPSLYAGSWVRVLLDYPVSFPAHVALWLTDACSCPHLLTFSHICPNLNRLCALVTQGHSGGGCGLPSTCYVLCTHYGFRSHMLRLSSAQVGIYWRTQDCSSFTFQVWNQLFMYYWVHMFSPLSSQLDISFNHVSHCLMTVRLFIWSIWTILGVNV